MINSHPASFRDSSGFIFVHDGIVHRFINKSCKDDFELLIQSGLYKKLTETAKLIPHEEVQIRAEWQSANCYRVIRPINIPVISYPYEWSFEQLKDAAILTLDVAMEALNHGLILKDATAFNVQMYNGKLIFIDTLSFTKYKDGAPWVAYRQFIRHFFGFLLLMSHVAPDINKLMRVYHDGIPLNIARGMLPRRLAFHPLIFLNIYLHSHYEEKFQKSGSSPSVKLSKFQLFNSLTLLKKMIEKCELKTKRTTWSDYYSETNYSKESLNEKEILVVNMLQSVAPHFGRLLDLGGNNGKFSRAVRHLADTVISVDIDPLAVNQNYKINRFEKIDNIISIQLDFTNPSSAIGWECLERDDFFVRMKSDVVVCLAFIHHMVIAENVPFERVASALSRLASMLVIEFPDHNDSQVQRLLQQKDENHKYNRVEFEKGFEQFFQIKDRVQIEGSCRFLYIMIAKTGSVGKLVSHELTT